MKRIILIICALVFLFFMGLNLSARGTHKSGSVITLENDTFIGLSDSVLSNKYSFYLSPTISTTYSYYSLDNLTNYPINNTSVDNSIAIGTSLKLKLSGIPAIEVTISPEFGWNYYFGSGGELVQSIDYYYDLHYRTKYTRISGVIRYIPIDGKIKPLIGIGGGIRYNFNQKARIVTDQFDGEVIQSFSSDIDVNKHLIGQLGLNLGVEYRINDRIRPYLDLSCYKWITSENNGSFTISIKTGVFFKLKR